jgi:hypothetical protein
MSEPTNKAELLAEMQRSYLAFEALMAPLSEAQLTEAGVNGDWSIKDVLAHIMTWQGRINERLEKIARHEDAARLDPPIENEEQMNAFNAATFATNRSRPLSEIQTAFHASVQRLAHAVEASNESDLFEPDRFPWMEGDALWKNVGGNSFWHYEEHTPMIQEWRTAHRV